MQDLRTFIAERSKMNIYIREESFELQPQYVGFILEGFIRIQGDQQELLTAPAAIFPHLDRSSFPSETLGSRVGSFYHQASVYQVETRARVITFDTVGFEAGRTLLQRSAERPSGSLGREPGGLMSWPEYLFESNHHVAGEVPGDHNNLSCKKKFDVQKSDASASERKELLLNESHASSDDSGCEDEHIVIID